ncbi:MAG: phenylalanine--tRNA ligase subunit beta, partial [Gelidibacter sp.]
EILSNSLTTPSYANLSADLIEEQNVVMLNPLSQDLSVMRQSLLFSGLEAINRNINRRRQDLKLFEFGKTYHNHGDKYIENKHLALFVTGNKDAERWNTHQEPSNFFYLKGIITAILERLGLNEHKISPIENDVFSEGISLRLGKKTLVDFGLVNKKIMKHFDISQDVLFADFNWDNVIDLAKNTSVNFNELPKYPATRRDFALLIDDNVTFEAIDTIAKQTEKRLLKHVDLFDVYQGEKLPKGKKSYAVSFKFQDEHSTLTDKQVDKIMQKLQSNFEEQLGAELR